MPTKDTETKRRSVSGLLALQRFCCLHDSRWDDDVVFRNQARGTENKGKKEFVNVRDHVYRAIASLSQLLSLGFASVRLPQTIYGK